MFYYIKSFGDLRKFVEKNWRNKKKCNALFFLFWYQINYLKFHICNEDILFIYSFFFFLIQISDDFGVQSTFNEILIKTIRTAQNLQKLNYSPKGVVGVIANNNPDLAPILFASFCLGCPVSPLDPAFGKLEIKSIISITKPRVFFCDVNLYDLLETCLKELNIEADIFTFTGQRGNSKPVEDLFAETKNETEFL